MADHSFAVVPASYVYLVRDGQVLLQRRHHTGYMDGYWVAGAAGHVEPGETAREAAVREAAEEIGVVIAPEALELVSVMQRTDGTDNPREQRVDWFWTAQRWVGDPSIGEPHKTQDLRWFPVDALPEPIPDYERLILNGLRDGTLPRDTALGFERQPATPLTVDLRRGAHDPQTAHGASDCEQPSRREGLRAPQRPEIICLCGSMRFAEQIRAAHAHLARSGKIVLAPGEASLMATGPLSPEQKAQLDALHRHKIDLADRVVVVNPGGYVGESTSAEIAYARAAGKPIAFTHQGDESGSGRDAED